MEFQIVFLCMIIGLAFISILSSSKISTDLVAHDFKEGINTKDDLSSSKKM